MAGQPRSRGVTAIRQGESRVRNRRARITTQYRRARTSADRLAAACDYVRAGLKRDHGSTVDRQVDEIARQLVALGHDLFEAQAKRRVA